MIVIGLHRRLKALAVLLLAAAFLAVPVASMADAQEHCADEDAFCTLVSGAASQPGDASDSDGDADARPGHCAGCHLGVFPLPEIAPHGRLSAGAVHGAPAGQSVPARPGGEQFRPPRL